MRANDCVWSLFPLNQIQVGHAEMVKIAPNTWFVPCCQQLREFTLGGPLANKWIACPYCGGYIVEKKPGA